MSSADLTRAQYAGADFSTHQDDLRARLQVKYGPVYNDFAVSALGMMLVDYTAWGLDTLSFYLDRRATDTYLATARTRKSISRLTRQLGYKMRPAVSASVDLTITVETSGFDIVIPKGFQFTGPNNLVFENAQTATWQATDSTRTKYLSCYEGETTTESFTAASTATVNQVFQLKRLPTDKFIAAGSVIVIVNGVAFKETEFLSFAATNQFEVGYNDEPPTIRFGDGIAGNIPTPGASIVVTYVTSSGKGGLVGAHSIIKTKNPLVVSFRPVALTVDNALGSVGGDDPEDLTHAKIYAPLVYKSRYVGVTRPDYEALAGSFADPLFGRVAVAQAISSRTAATDSHLTSNIGLIRAAIDAPRKMAAARVALSGTASVSTTGLVTGAMTKFLTEVSVGTWVSFSNDPTGTLRKVLDSAGTGLVTDDLQLTVSPAPPVALAAGSILRHGTAVVEERSLLKDLSVLLAGVDIVLAALGDKTGSIDAKVDATISLVRDEKDSAVAARLDVIATTGFTTAALSNGIYGLVTLGSGPTKVGSGANSSVIYVPKAANVYVLHTTTGPTVGVSVAASMVTVTLGSGVMTAREVMTAVNAHPAASLLVLAVYTGDGSGNAESPSPSAIAVPAFLPPDVLSGIQTAVTAAQDRAFAASTSYSGIESGLDTVVTNLRTVRQGLEDVGTAPTSGILLTLANYNSTAKTTLGDPAVIAEYDSVESTTKNLVGNLDIIESAVVSNALVIGTALDSIYDHVDAMLSQDSQANLVTVPILARDKAGFFVAPSNGLIRALQEYLDARKEVTQTVQVTSGAASLALAVVLIRIGVNPNFSESIVKTTVESAVDAVLRGRKFGVSLYLSDFDGLRKIAGVVFANVQITGPLQYLDFGAGNSVGQASNGNLIIPVDKVITKGQVTVTTETVVSAG